jgi:hypothetical protein
MSDGIWDSENGKWERDLVAMGRKDVATFRPIAEQPHETARMLCQMCGHDAVHVWPQRAEIKSLECGGCRKVGFLILHGGANGPKQGA